GPAPTPRKRPRPLWNVWAPTPLTAFASSTSRLHTRPWEKLLPPKRLGIRIGAEARSP
ncbi:uncharacterized protein METZ01_LOCUS430461, partial [marine metagenome]